MLKDQNFLDQTKLSKWWALRLLTTLKCIDVFLFFWLTIFEVLDNNAKQDWIDFDDLLISRIS